VIFLDYPEKPKLVVPFSVKSWHWTQKPMDFECLQCKKQIVNEWGITHTGRICIGRDEHNQRVYRRKIYCIPCFNSLWLDTPDLTEQEEKECGLIDSS